MKIHILGFGTMGQAIAKKLVLKKSNTVWVFTRSPRKLKKVRGVLADSALQHIKQADLVLVAVKPQDIQVLADQVKNKINSKSVIVSIAAGVKLNRLAQLFGQKKVARIMPNLGLQVSQGMALWQAATAISKKDKGLIKRFLNNFTEHFETRKEIEIDLGSLIYGCAPAYFFLLASILEDSASKFGFSPQKSRKLVEKTFLAAAILQHGKTYEDLIKKVASKKGITEAVLNSLEKKHIRKIFRKALADGYKRTKELHHG